MAVCEILSVGTEILLGDILNTNSRYLSVELAKIGISVLRHTTVGDNAQRLAAALTTALERSDIVIATGLFLFVKGVGLSPHMHLTRQMRCLYFCQSVNSPLRISPYSFGLFLLFLPPIKYNIVLKNNKKWRYKSIIATFFNF